MRGKIALLGLVAATAVTVPVASAGGPVDKATGGGQVLIGTQGAGNTIAFTAQALATDSNAAKGQVQFIDREAGRGRDQVKHHGRVTCIEAVGTVAKIAGTLRNDNSFNLYVEDTGEGQGNADVIYFDSMADTPECDFDNPDQDDLQALARGNAQVYDAGTTANTSRKRSLTYRNALKLAGLR